MLSLLPTSDERLFILRRSERHSFHTTRERERVILNQPICLAQKMLHILISKPLPLSLPSAEKTPHVLKHKSTELSLLREAASWPFVCGRNSLSLALSRSSRVASPPPPFFIGVSDKGPVLHGHVSAHVVPVQAHVGQGQHPKAPPPPGPARNSLSQVTSHASRCSLAPSHALPRFTGFGLSQVRCRSRKLSEQ